MSPLSFLCAVFLFLFSFFVFRLFGLLGSILLSRRRRTPTTAPATSATAATAKHDPTILQSEPSMATATPATATNPPATRIRTMVILGSGGHTAEMLSVLSGVDPTRHSFTFLRAATDLTSEARVRSQVYGKDTYDGKDAYDGQNAYGASPFLTLPRSREVGQSYRSSIATTLIALGASFSLLWRARPEIVICNGPGTGVPVCIMAFIIKFFFFRPCRLIFLESFCRVLTLSLSGLFLYPLVDQFIVQWPQLQRDGDAACDMYSDTNKRTEEKQTETTNTTNRPGAGWRGVKYIGRLC